jgi:hypothetical protein
MSSQLRIALLAALALGGTAADASAQEPKLSKKWYEDATDLGFRFRSPEGWNFIPPQPGMSFIAGQYTSPAGQFLIDKNGRGWDYGLWIVPFDRRPKKPAAQSTEKVDGKEVKIELKIAGPRSVKEWVEEAFSEISPRLIEEEPSRVGKIETVESTFTGMVGELEVHVFATLFHLKEDIDVALIFNGPGGRNWTKFERAFKKICDTFAPVEVKELEVASGPRSLRDRKRDELTAEIAKLPGWKLYETANYFVVSSNKDAQFLEELMQRLEAIRTVYAETYPPALALELRRKADIARREAKAKAEAERKAKGESEAEGEGEAPAEGEEPAKEGEGDDKDQEQEPPEGTTVATSADPMEQSRTSVVRVCQNRDEYGKYGGPPGTAGYWSPGDKELVLFDDEAVLGRDATWSTLNHEAFHQYIYYFFGSLTPHYWYNEGTGDFYSGYQYKNKRFTLEPFKWRHREVQQMIRNGSDPSKLPPGSPYYVPLERFVRFDRSKYYDNDTIGWNYAQGWALIYFLRTGAKNASCWNPAWNTILDTYLSVLVETDDLDKAVDAAFAGVDWNELERCWKEYTLQ